jgi:Flp pilus assembly protein CpaB
MNKKIIIIIIVLVLLLGAAGAFLFANLQKTEKPGSEQEQVKSAVIGFGKVMQNVPLAASKSIVGKTMQDNYSAFVAPDLLASWIDNPSAAPGRLTSSPWPDHIEIFSTTKNTDGSYTVQSNVVEMTSRELVVGGVADMYGATITVRKQGGKWLITEFKKL